MTQIKASKLIAAPIDVVFRSVADIREFSAALPHVISYEFLTEGEPGVGTRFRETRLMKGREASTELEITEFVDNDHVRIVADSHGTVWDTIFSVAPEGESTLLTMTMDARSYKLLPRLMNKLISGMIKKAVESDLEQVKAYCEGKDI